MTDIVEDLRKRAEIRRQIPSRKSVQSGEEDRLAAQLDGAADEIERLREKCDKQALVLEGVFAEQRGFTPFICGVGGERDSNNMPERFHICPAYGCDFSYIYHRGEVG